MKENKNRRTENPSSRSEAPAPATGNTVNEYTVEERDTLEDIARKHNMSWNEIYEANKDAIVDKDKVMPGLRLNIPNRRP